MRSLLAVTTAQAGPVEVAIAEIHSIRNDVYKTQSSHFGALPTPPEHRFFLVFEWNDEHAETTQRLAEWIKSGQLKYRESVAEGLDAAVGAFRGMLRGENFGKQLVKISDG